MLFHIIDDSFVIYRKNGVYKQEQVYERNGYLYTKQGNGFSRLCETWEGKLGTTYPNTIIEEIQGVDYEIEPYTKWIKLK